MILLLMISLSITFPCDWEMAHIVSKENITAPVNRRKQFLITIDFSGDKFN